MNLFALCEEAKRLVRPPRQQKSEFSGRSKHPLYHTWIQMKGRCAKKENPQFHHYGGRGIKVCDRWLSSFEAFSSDMGPREPGMSLDRIDVNGNYEPSNCRWASSREQNENRRDTVFLEIEGKRYKRAELARQSGRSLKTLNRRARNGMTLEEVVSPENAGHKYLPLASAISARKRGSSKVCGRGHEYTEENTYRTKTSKGCRTCRRALEMFRYYGGDKSLEEILRGN